VNAEDDYNEVISHRDVSKLVVDQMMPEEGRGREGLR